MAFAPGDFNGNGIVDAADYTVWRNTLNSTSDLRANGDNTGASAGKIDAADYAVWKANYGRINGQALGTNGTVTGVVRYQSFSGSGSGSVDAGLSQVPSPPRSSSLRY